MGGSSQEPAPPPPAPSPIETSREAIQAQIEAVPQILQTQQEFGPQFSQLELEQLQQFGPEFAQTALDIQKEFGPQFAEVERELAPELAESQRTLTEFLKGTDEEEFARLVPGLTEGVRAAQSFRGLGDISPLGALDESIQVQQLRESLKNRRLNIALSTAGRVPISSFPQVQGQTGGPGQLVQNINPQSIFGAQAANQQTAASIFSTQAGIFANQPPGILGQIAGGIAGGAVGGFSGGIGTGFASSFFPKTN